MSGRTGRAPTAHGPLIVIAEFGAADFAWLDGLRRTYYPSERNHVPAHLTMFHALPPSSEGEVRGELSKAVAGRAPDACISGVMDLGSGVALKVRSDGLDEIRDRLADHFHGLLTAQDARGWSAHITIQNKVERGVARELLDSIKHDFEPRPLAVRGLSLFRYLGGPWGPLAQYRFRN